MLSDPRMNLIGCAVTKENTAGRFTNISRAIANSSEWEISRIKTLYPAHEYQQYLFWNDLICSQRCFLDRMEKKFARLKVYTKYITETAGFAVRSSNHFLYLRFSLLHKSMFLRTTRLRFGDRYWYANSMEVKFVFFLCIDHSSCLNSLAHLISKGTTRLMILPFLN